MKKLLLSLIFIVSFSSLTFALTFVVNNNGDTNDVNTADNLCADSSGNCTLRAAIQQANVSASDDIIEFSSTVFNTAQTVILTNGELEINNVGRLTINGSGANLLQISGNNQSRIFFVTQNTNVDINNVTLTQGNGRGSLSTNTGGAIFNNGGVINLQNTVITGNSTGSGGSDGGGIYNTFAGTVTLSNSTVTNNTGNAGGGISSIGGFIDVVNSTISNNTAFAGGGVSTYNLRVTNSTIANNIAVRGGGVYVNFGTATIANSTISGNTATGDFFRDAEGGGIYVDRETLVINNATITNNTSNSSVSRGGGIFTTSDAGTQTFVRNTIVAANIISGGTSQDIFKGGASILTSDGNNLIGNNTGAETSFPAGNPNANGDKVGTSSNPIDPKLGALQNNGGQTATHALLAGSPAIDSGNNCVVTATCPSNNPPFPLTTDQRGAGFSRQVDGNNDGVATVDIGAFEALAPTAATVTLSGKITNAKGRGIFRAIVTLTDSNGESRFAYTNPFGYYRFNDVAAGNTYILAVRHKSYAFTPQVLSIVDDYSDLNFIASEGRYR